MADTYNIKILLKAQLEESKKILDTIDEIREKSNHLAEQGSVASRVVSGALYDVGTDLREPLAKRSIKPNPSCFTTTSFGDSHKTPHLLQSLFV